MLLVQRSVDLLDDLGLDVLLRVIRVARALTRIVLFIAIRVDLSGCLTLVLAAGVGIQLHSMTPVGAIRSVQARTILLVLVARRER